MSNYAGLGDLVEQIREASGNIRLADEKNSKRLDGIEASVNELYKRTGRPGGYADLSDTDETQPGRHWMILQKESQCQ
jgi:hypothetical protein